MPLYVGVENEFQLMVDGSESSFADYFYSYMTKYSKPHHKKGNTCIRTLRGSSVYADGDEPEVVTPPIRVQKGFVSEIINAVYSARKDILEFIDCDRKSQLIGYSSHFNLTNHGTEPYENVVGAVMERGLIPMSLFVLNPLSSGIGLRSKPDRYELLGDHIPSEEQIGAFMLLYAASVPHIRGKTIPLRKAMKYDVDYDYEDPAIKAPNLVTNGRATEVMRKRRHRKGQYWTMTAQDYLEIYYSVFKDDVAQIATSSDIKLLEDFVFGRRSLEIDKREFYQRHADLKDEDGFLFDQALCIDRSSYADERPIAGGLPSFFSWLTSQPPTENWRIKRMEWNYIRMTAPGDNCTCDTCRYGGDQLCSLGLSGMDKLEFVWDILRQVSSENQVQCFKVLRNEDDLELIQRLAGTPLDALDGQDKRKAVEKGLLVKRSLGEKLVGHQEIISQFGEQVIAAYKAAKVSA
jgi:hypothetical protein